MEIECKLCGWAARRHSIAAAQGLPEAARIKDKAVGFVRPLVNKKGRIDHRFEPITFEHKLLKLEAAAKALADSRSEFVH